MKYSVLQLKANQVTGERNDLIISRLPSKSLKHAFAKVAVIDWTWLLPAAALGLTIYLSSNYTIRLANESLVYKLACFNLLVPALALWLSIARQTEPRVLIWASIPAIVFMVPAIPTFACYIYFFNSDNKKIRIAGQCLLAGIAGITTVMFAISLFWNRSVIYDNETERKITESVTLGRYQVMLKADNEPGAPADCVVAEMPLGKWFKLVHFLASDYQTIYSNLRVVDRHTISVDEECFIQNTRGKKVIQCKF